MKHNSEFRHDELEELIADLGQVDASPRAEFDDELQQKFITMASLHRTKPQLGLLWYGHKLRASMGFLALLILVFVVFISLNNTQSPSYDWLINKVHAANEGFISAVSSSTQSSSRDKNLTQVKISTKFGNLNQDCMGPGSIFPVPNAAEYDATKYWDTELGSEFPYTKHVACDQQNVCSVTLYNGVNSIQYKGGEYAVDHGPKVYITESGIEQYYDFNSGLFPRGSRIEVEGNKYVVTWQRERFCEDTSGQKYTTIWQAEFDKHTGTITGIKISDSNFNLISSSTIKFSSNQVSSYTDVSDIFKFNPNVPVIKPNAQTNDNNEGNTQLKQAVINGAKLARDYLLTHRQVVIAPLIPRPQLTSVIGYSSQPGKAQLDYPAYETDRNFYAAGEDGDTALSNRLKEIAKNNQQYANSEAPKLTITYNVGTDKIINNTQVGSQYTVSVYKTETALEKLVRSNLMTFYPFQRISDKTIVIDEKNLSAQVYKSSEAKAQMFQDEYLVAFVYNDHKYVISFFGEEPLAFNYRSLELTNLNDILDFILTAEMRTGTELLKKEDLL